MISGREYTLLLSFNCCNVADYIDEIKKIAGHMPSFWSVTEQDRQFIKNFMATADTGNAVSVVRFSVILVDDDVMNAHYIELINAITEQCGSKFFIHLATDFITPLPGEEKLLCQHAVAGYSDELLASLHTDRLRALSEAY